MAVEMKEVGDSVLSPELAAETGAMNAFPGLPSSKHIVRVGDGSKPDLLPVQNRTVC
jgi:hypothetical protein